MVRNCIGAKRNNNVHHHLIKEASLARNQDVIGTGCLVQVDLQIDVHTTARYLDFL